jgi:hypothetical protein
MDTDTVTEPSGEKETVHINVVGYIIAGGVALLLLPVLPLLLVLKLLDRGDDRRDVQEI